jgi:hypothetical protein
MENRLEASVMAKNTVFVRIRTFLCQEKNMYLHNYPIPNDYYANDKTTL